MYLCFMFFVDTHTHLYLDAFDADRTEVVKRAVEQDIRFMLLPNIDSLSATPLLSLCRQFPENCFPMMGLHPTSVKEDFEQQLEYMGELFDQHAFVAVGETGIDLYWDKTYRKEQEKAFRYQADLALERKLPLVIHSRESFHEIIHILEDYRGSGLTGVFHCFTGNSHEAGQAIDLGFMLGIGGVITFRNAKLDEVVENIGLEHLLLETDSPFLAPMPFRGKRNESAYINLIANKISQVKQLPREQVAEITTENALRLFNLKHHA